MPSTYLTGYVLIALVIIVFAVRNQRRKAAALRRLHEAHDRWVRAVPAYQRIHSLYNAAMGSDAELRQRLGVEHTNVNSQNPDGDTALHLAYFAGHQDAIARLTAFDADETLRNRRGLVPVEMSEVAKIERLLMRALACMSGCGWTDETSGRPLYEELRTCPPHVYGPALVDVFSRIVHRRPEAHLSLPEPLMWASPLQQAPPPQELVCLAVKVGLPGSEPTLAALLDAHGTMPMAADFLDSGSAELASASRQWSAKHRDKVHFPDGRTGPQWRRF